jgi:hypothetical protein
MWESHEDFPSMMMECHVGTELKKLNGELEHLKSAPKTISSNVLHLYSDGRKEREESGLAKGEGLQRRRPSLRA